MILYYKRSTIYIFHIQYMVVELKPHNIIGNENLYAHTMWLPCIPFNRREKNEYLNQMSAFELDTVVAYKVIHWFRCQCHA